MTPLTIDQVKALADAARSYFEIAHCGKNKHMVRRNEVGDYVIPEVNDAWCRFRTAAELYSPALNALCIQQAEEIERLKTAQETNEAAQLIAEFCAAYKVAILNGGGAIHRHVSPVIVKLQKYAHAKAAAPQPENKT